MGKIYAKAIVAGTRSLGSIGATWQAATVEALEDMLENGTISEDQFEELTRDAR